MSHAPTTKNRAVLSTENAALKTKRGRGRVRVARIKNPAGEMIEIINTFDIPKASVKAAKVSKA